MQTDRLEAIRHHLYTQGACSIPALAEAVGTSLATVRRDLQLLEQQGIVSRSHGSARIANGAETEAAFAVREKQNLEAKRAIAQAAYDLLEPHSAVFLDAGTTVLQLVRLLRIAPLPLTVFTNGLVVAQELMPVAKIKTSLIGGQLRVENASLVGPAAEAALHGLWFDQLFLGAGAVGDDGLIYSVDPAEASLNALMRQRSAETVMLADATKFGRRATYVVTAVNASLQVITDDALPAAACAAVRQTGAALSLVTPAGRSGLRLASGRVA
ncbi:DeoR/GlpR family DNA-binding transcription regulator [Lichenihabitans sp. Uapishka_5]|uniref:DeoR/GlpR family DNA-binding transcription regulator n=1 Tax=Lichenihabitans sp. Uapishka_5 TaxID=3037302 RepID=UPI0029E81B60|nr:DeoR/GlpR family DNA-binding transcription regulator [Lichenihabitans sp. Uapishka_5]MDX7950801.1 DeoR/GlpR family DNA-binding transcription regulator [Lichenihabitans sp. Uapishka_5]